MLFVYDPIGSITPQDLLARKIVHVASLVAGSELESELEDVLDVPEVEVPVPPVIPTLEDSNNEIISIVRELSIKQFNSMPDHRRAVVLRQYIKAMGIVSQRTQLSWRMDPADPLYSTHHNGAPLKYDSDGVCYAVVLGSDSYSWFDVDSREHFTPESVLEARRVRQAEGDKKRAWNLVQSLRDLQQ